MAGEDVEIGPSGASERYDLVFQTRITSYFAYRFAERDIVINWRSRGDIYDGRMAPVATVLPGLSDAGTIVTIHKSFDFALVEMHIRQRPDFIRSLPLPPNKSGFVNLPDVQDLPYVYRSIYSVRDG